VPYTHYERLTAIDAAFLEVEDHNVHMHVGAVAIFEGEALRTTEGALDIERIREYIGAALHDTPRFRQKLAYVPLLKHPVWVDDERFNLRYHVRHTALPAPGDDRQLKRLAARVMSQQLERNKPMWEMWVVEGLSNGRFALVVKAHHCMVDGIAGIDLLAVLLRFEPERERANAHRPWIMRARPSGPRLLVDEVVRRATWPLTAVAEAPRVLLDPGSCVREVRNSIGAVVETLAAGLSPSSPTPFNTEVGPYRRFDWAEMNLDDTRTVRERFGGKLNDVVLSVAAGAVRKFLVHRGVRVSDKTVFRAMVPVSIRQVNQKGEPGNRVVNYLARLPIHIEDPVERLQRTIEITAELKKSRVVQGAEAIEELSDHTFTSVVVQLVRLATTARAYNVVITNVPGPPFPIYFMGAKMTAIYPLVPLFKQQGLGIALFSYAGRLHWGFNADWDAMPDLHDFVGAVTGEFEWLLERAGGLSTRGETSESPGYHTNGGLRSSS
jgi:WS/DGAT/MGAT family acyltransferase